MIKKNMQINEEAMSELMGKNKPETAAAGESTANQDGEDDAVRMVQKF